MRRDSFVWYDPSGLDVRMNSPRAHTAGYPTWMRWLSLAWLLVWLPAYWRTWGAVNFIHLCDVAMILTCLGMWIDSPLLIASQTVNALLVDFAWLLDASWMIFLHHPLFGGNEFLLDPRYPLWVRTLTIFHIVLPAVQLWGLARFGYDRRGYALQCAIALPVFIAARFTPPAKNIDFAFTDPFLHVQWGPAPVHVLISWLFMVVVIYLPTHLFLKRLFPPPQLQTL